MIFGAVDFFTSVIMFSEIIFLQIHLEPVEEHKAKRSRKKRKARKLIIDNVTQISRESIREQATSFHDTMRHQVKKKLRYSFITSA